MRPGRVLFLFLLLSALTDLHQKQKAIHVRRLHGQPTARIFRKEYLPHLGRLLGVMLGTAVLLPAVLIRSLSGISLSFYRFFGSMVLGGAAVLLAATGILWLYTRSQNVAVGIKRQTGSADRLYYAGHGLKILGVVAALSFVRSLSHDKHRARRMRYHLV